LTIVGVDVDVPVFINCRDRLEPLRKLVSWLERAGCEEIYLLDNDSAYEPLLDYYRQSPHRVLMLGANYGKNAPWTAPGVPELMADRPFVYTDPDVIPDERCPLDALDLFAELLGRYGAVNKAGFGLRIDDLPDHYRHKEAVIAWERRFWEWPLERGAYYAPLDTTFALYRVGSGPRPAEAVRTGPPYVARHDSWYIDFDNLREDEACYQARCAADSTETAASHWSRQTLAGDFVSLLERERLAQPARLQTLETRLRWRLRGRRTIRRSGSTPAAS
jgi:hypothetical protein